MQPVLLGLLADHEGVESPAVGGRGVQHRAGDRVGAQGQPAHRVVVQVGGQRPHHPADDRRGDTVQRDPAHVDVEVGLPSGGEHHVLPHHGEVVDETDQGFTIGSGDIGASHARDSSEPEHCATTGRPAERSGPQPRRAI
ncbi:hypothetical protein SDC9_195448 [bioreactor metagenome]|uniref:Uncharacterized protein n=1 Tax=bioreactor metagenome TaxID=1076179 RepID=A0A645IHR3_9ZZZZ